MAFHCLTLMGLIRTARFLPRHLNCHTVALQDTPKRKEYKTEHNFVYLEDPDTFGTLSGTSNRDDTLEDEGDIKEEKFLQTTPLRSQKLTTKQYADLIKQYVENKRIKEAIDVLEVRMLSEDRVKPENYIYNILIGACADVGYTKKAFKLFNDMKRRAISPTGDTYTCLFHACSNSPWSKDGLKNAKHLRELMIQKGIEPNLTNYNAMIKAFGRCEDLATAFQIVDEMISKKIKIRVHTFNHLLQACISDKTDGLRHALIVWRKMLKMREKPNIYSFNLMLKCVKECDLGTKEDIAELIGTIEQHITPNTRILGVAQNTAIESGEKNEVNAVKDICYSIAGNESNKQKLNYEVLDTGSSNNRHENLPTEERNGVMEYQSVPIELIDKKNKIVPKVEERSIPNLLSRSLQMQEVLALKDVNTVQDKFAMVGGQDDFLREMEACSVKPDIKTFTQMLPLLEENKEAELKLLESMESSGVVADIDFYNMLIKKRCLRSDYGAAIEVKHIIEQEIKRRKRKYGLKKKYLLKKNIMTYGVLAMACDTKQKAACLLIEMKEEQLKVNIEILGTLLKHGAMSNQLDYINYIMSYVKDNNLKPNKTFIKHLEMFNAKCTDIVEKAAEGQSKWSPNFIKSVKKFAERYMEWLKDFDIDNTMKEEHPWKQYQEPYPQTVQHSDVRIKEPKRFYKRDRTFVRYKAKL